jgi:histone demethylase JARID1
MKYLLIAVAISPISYFLFKVDSWEEKAKSCLAAKPRLSLAEVEALVREGEAISSGLPTLPTLKESLRKAREWLSKAEGLKHPDNYPYVDSLEALVARGRPLPVRLDPLPFLETQVNSARAWRERTGIKIIRFLSLLIVKLAKPLIQSFC